MKLSKQELAKQEFSEQAFKTVPSKQEKVRLFPRRCVEVLSGHQMLD
jgi:hypothetical protein